MQIQNKVTWKIKVLYISLTICETHVLCYAKESNVDLILLYTEVIFQAENFKNYSSL